MQLLGLYPGMTVKYPEDSEYFPMHMAIVLDGGAWLFIW